MTKAADVSMPAGKSRSASRDRAGKKTAPDEPLMRQVPATPPAEAPATPAEPAAPAPVMAAPTAPASPAPASAGAPPQPRDAAPEVVPAVAEDSAATKPIPIPADQSPTDVPHEPPPTESIIKDPPPADVAPMPPLLFECAWEVCWQLGGIYTVLRSKVQAMQDRWGDRYFLIGPYNPSTAAVEFEEMPTEGIIRATLDRLRAQGIACHFGRWLVPGRPRVILLDYRARYHTLDTDKYLLWKDHGIPTVANDGEVNDVVAFGFTVAEFFRQLREVVPDQPILGHFHEWMGAVAVPRIAHMQLPISTIFTTHATLLGRYLASDNPHFYDHLPYVDPDKEAAHFNIYPRFAIERAAAHASTVFTTVSEVTAVEAEKLLGRPADVILPNGLNIHRFAALHEFQNLHRQYKERIHEFVMGHFFPSYNFDLDRTLYFFTSGRYEYRNKGYDLFLEAMWRLNQRLKQVEDPPTVVGFIITKAMVRGISVSALQAQAQFDELKETCTQLEKEMGRRLFQAAANGRVPSNVRELIDDDAQVRLKRAIHAWRTNQWPSVVTHDLADDGGDPILQHIRHRNLINCTDDPVKIVFHPQFVSSTSPLLSLDYDQFVRGCHVGVFPSYYEPWGYTPMEAVALGVPAVTTDLSGFGAYVQRHIENAGDKGLCVLNRRTKSFEQSVEDLVDFLMRICLMNRRQRIELRNRVESTSMMFDWSQLVVHYHEAHDLALQRKGAPRHGKFELRMV